MKISEVQPHVKTLLEAHPGLTDAAVVLDDGTGEANPARQILLRKAGVCLIVWRVEGGDVVDVSRTGALVERLLIFVFVEESVAVSRSEQGAGLKHEDATQYVMEALSGAVVGPDRITLEDPPFINMGRVNGVNRLMVCASTLLTITPTNAGQAL
ncbi:MAG: hypothetical protein HS113_21110 [Verrucomicrobiales bacterium]|nr:hypothetical protein [Verrucomicrobiales bacterium]